MQASCANCHLSPTPGKTLGIHVAVIILVGLPFPRQWELWVCQHPPLLLPTHNASILFIENCFVLHGGPKAISFSIIAAAFFMAVCEFASDFNRY